MSRPGFLEGAGLALCLAVGGAVTAAVLPALLGGTVAARLVIALLAAVYLGYLLYRAHATVGRVVVPCLWAAVTVAGWLTLGFTAFTLMQIALVWLIRSLYCHGGVLAALADLGLTAFAVAAAVWALGTGSWLLAIWCFFLVQALHGWIPSPRPPRPDDPICEDHDFELARAQAQAALERLATRH